MTRIELKLCYLMTNKGTLVTFDELSQLLQGSFMTTKIVTLKLTVIYLDVTCK